MRLLLLAVLFLFLVEGSPVFAQSGTVSPARIVLVEENGDGGYRMTSDPALSALRNDMIRRAPLENYVQFMRPLRLNKTLGILAKQCDMVNMWYDPSTRTITVCYEFLKWVDEYVEEVVRVAQNDNVMPFPIELDREAMIAGTFAGVVLHERATLYSIYWRCPYSEWKRMPRISWPRSSRFSLIGA
jgi:hypothetical protein